MTTHEFDLLIVGGGPVGLLAALALISSDLSLGMIYKPSHADAGRTVALMKPNIDFLKKNNVFTKLSGKISPLKKLRIVDATQQILKAPTITFAADELGLDEFGYNIPNLALINTLEKMTELCGIQKYFEHVESVSFNNKRVILQTARHTISAKYIIAADGKNSKLREAAGIESKRWSYNQHAITAIFEHTVDHNNISTEFQTQDGPLTLVPLPGRSSSLVCVLKDQNAKTAMQLSDDEFCRMIEKKSQHILGDLRIKTPRHAWKLEGLLPKSFAEKNIFCVGEAAHVFPPIGAQGLNLGFRDIDALVSIFINKIGIENATHTYNKMRTKDIQQRTKLIDLANKSLVSHTLWPHLPRKLGLFAAQNIPYMRRKMMEFGLGLNENSLNTDFQNLDSAQQHS